MMRVVVRVTVVGVGLVVAAGCGSSSSPINPPMVTAVHPSIRAVPITAYVGSSGDRHPQRFCAVSPARGTMRYVVQGDQARLVVRASRIPSTGLVGIVWGPGGGHEGEEIAAVTVTSGNTVQSTLRMFHAPYYDRPGTVIKLTKHGRAVATLHPC
jgi:hypothetical protein